MIFHLVSRTHRREEWFVPELRTEIAGLVHGLIGRTDAQLLAYAVMPSHLHVLLRQGRSELGAVMQPLLRRVARRVQRHHGFEGSVVERAFRDRRCETADHAREALIYIHLNPWRAGLCGDDLSYPWMSQRAYLPGADPASFGIDSHAQSCVLDLFALADGRSRRQRGRDYLTWLKRRMDLDRARAVSRSTLHDALEQPVEQPLPRPDSSSGDRAWLRHFAAFALYDVPGPEHLLPDLRDYVASQLPRYAPGCTAEDLRGSWLPRPHARFRMRIIKAAADRGYRTGDLAVFFEVSPPTVSRAKYAPDG